MTDLGRLMCEKALSLVGQGYIYGAKGQTCSLAFRQQQAAQYPDQAEHILGEGAKWDGMPVWDCAQLTRVVAKAAGIPLVSGATSQWTKTKWACSGTIDALPQKEAAFLYRQRDGRMQHTGISLGDGTFIHARGTAYGVVRQDLSAHAWTHWAIPWAVEASVDSAPANPIGMARVWAQSGSTVNVRREPGGAVIDRLVIGSLVEVCAQSAGWTTIRHNGGTAYMQTAFLKSLSADDTLQTILDRINHLDARLTRAGL